MSDEEDGAVEDKRVDWLLNRVEHRPLMFKLDRINKMKIDEHSMCALPCWSRRRPATGRPPRPAAARSPRRWVRPAAGGGRGFRYGRFPMWR